MTAVDYITVIVTLTAILTTEPVGVDDDEPTAEFPRAVVRAPWWRRLIARLRRRPRAVRTCATCPSEILDPSYHTHCFSCWLDLRMRTWNAEADRIALERLSREVRVAPTGTIPGERCPS